MSEVTRSRRCKSKNSRKSSTQRPQICRPPREKGRPAPLTSSLSARSAAPHPVLNLMGSTSPPAAKSFKESVTSSCGNQEAFPILVATKPGSLSPTWDPACPVAPSVPRLCSPVKQAKRNSFLLMSGRGGRVSEVSSCSKSHSGERSSETGLRGASVALCRSERSFLLIDSYVLLVRTRERERENIKLSQR